MIIHLGAQDRLKDESSKRDESFKRKEQLLTQALSQTRTDGDFG